MRLPGCVCEKLNLTYYSCYSFWVISSSWGYPFFLWKGLKENRLFLGGRTSQGLKYGEGKKGNTLGKSKRAEINEPKLGESKLDVNFAVMGENPNDQEYSLISQKFSNVWEVA